MENDSAKLVDVIESSLNMVRDSAAYIGLISLKYGQTPEDFSRNPEGVSITELEFNEALRLNRPILLFIMGKDHLVKEADIEQDPAKKAKLNAFRERAKKMRSGSDVNRVYAVFESLAEFKDKIAPSLSGLRLQFEPEDSADNVPVTTAEPDTIPTPPAFYAEPDYIGSHQFVGRDAQLQELNDWALAADPTNLLLYEAIGGNGKSMLTWEWTTNHAMGVRQDWAGRFWYSFYERGALMADFCRRALAYMTGRPLEDFAKKKTVEMANELLAQCHAKPWLLILDGLERVLVAYHRIDAAEVPDEEANAPTDKIVDRNPCDAIREEDNDLLRFLAAAKPSKILVSSRLTPRVLLNASGQAINGVKRLALPGLRPPDAEKLLRSCGVKGDSAAIQSYLSTNCDNHPLVVGILGGLVSSYLPDRGNFDAWAADLEGGAKLDLAGLDLIQRWNHILRAALDALEPASRALLSTLALLPESFDYQTLRALDPHVPPDSKKLGSTISDLEYRGLLQYNRGSKRYDLHPVVRGVASGWTKADDKERYGQRVVDYFSALPHDPYEQAETLDDLRPGLHVIRTLLNLGHFQKAADAYSGDLSRALLFNVEANAQILSLLRPFFPVGWSVPPMGLTNSSAGYLANNAALALDSSGYTEEALKTFGAIVSSGLKENNWEHAGIRLSNIGVALINANRNAEAIRVNSLALDLASKSGNEVSLFSTRFDLFCLQSRLGLYKEAGATWALLDPMGRAWPRAMYRPGDAEESYAEFLFRCGTLEEGHLAKAEELAAKGRNRQTLREIHWLRGTWRLERGEWGLAVASFSEAVRMARDRGVIDATSEAGLALAKHNLGLLAEPRREVERLIGLSSIDDYLVARFWLALGDHRRAVHHALAAYKWAWADGEPYVLRCDLTKAAELLHELNVPIPNLPPYDPAKCEKFPWEDEVLAAIEKLREKSRPI